MANPDDYGRAIAGLLTYNPGPGIYSRLERAIQAMPENVRTQELPGLLKRYKDGVPGWELKETDLDSVIAGRDVVPREELLARVKERSPVYTHKEVVLSEGGPVIKDQPHYSLIDFDGKPLLDDLPVYQDEASRIGGGIKHGDPKYDDYSQGGRDYTEILLAQPGARSGDYGNHWSRAATNSTAAHQDAVAHARFDVHDGYLRVNELQSDLGIHNRKVREAAATYKSPPEQLPGESNSAYLDRAQEQGYVMQRGDDGRWIWDNDPRQQGIPFPLEDAWADLLLKRLNLYAAQHGLKGVEIASPRAIADKVGGNIGNYEHAYGKVAVGNQQRLGRKLGGMVEETMPQRSNAYERNLEGLRQSFHEPSREAGELLLQLRDGRIPLKPQGAFDMTPTPLERFDSLDHAYQAGMGKGMPLLGEPAPVPAAAEQLYATLVEDLVSRGIDPADAGRQAGEAMPRLVRLAEEQAARNVSFVDAQLAPHGPPPPASKVVYRGTMSDEMRRRILQEGIPAAVAIGIGADQMIDRLDREQR
jgi:hypothetical protein